MEHLTTAAIEKYIKGEYPYSQLLEISAHLLTCPEHCQKTLDHVDPNFLAEAERFENARVEAMNRVPHFSANEIEAYVTKEFNLEKRLEMNRHFTKCPRCSQQLKDRDPEYLSSFIKDNLSRNKQPEMVAGNEHPEITVGSEHPRSYFRMMVPVAGFSLLLAIFLVAVFMLPKISTSDQAKLNELSTPGNLAKTESATDGNNRANIITNSNQTKRENPLPTNTEFENKNSASKSSSLRQADILAGQKQPKPKQERKQQDIIIRNRSLNKNCENNPILAITPKDEIIIDLQPNLSWKPVPNAVGYKIYVSDTANNLVEQSPSIKEGTTSYKLTNKLELNKKYEWKVVVTLADGQEVYSESATFSVGEKSKKLSPIREKNKINDVRCLKTPN